ncbi:MAG: DinB family protein [Thermoanaerobaculia bacterium]
MKKSDPIREQLVRVLSWGDAHVDFDRAIRGVPAKLRGVRRKNLPYSLWQLLEHLRLAQRDILDFCRDPDYRAPKWPDDYWPARPAPPNARAWRNSVAAYRKDRRALERLAADPKVKLASRIPRGSGQTYLREVLLAADHAAYHLGEIIALRRLLGAWD